MKMKRKEILGKKENDPEYIHNIANFILNIEEEGKSDEYKKKLLDLFLEYKLEGMEPNKALKKAKKVLDCFGI